MTDILRKGLNRGNAGKRRKRRGGKRDGGVGVKLLMGKRLSEKRKKRKNCEQKGLVAQTGRATGF